MGVGLFDNLKHTGRIAERGEWRLTRRGEIFVTEFGIDLAALAAQRRPLCKACLDWSMRRHHLAGSLGAALLERVLVLGWAARERKSRAVLFTKSGEAKFKRLLER